MSSANGRLSPLQISETAADTAARLAEVDRRIAADVAWIDETFAAALANNSDGVFRMMQAEPALVSTTPGAPNDIVTGDEFAAIRAEIFAKAAAFGKPVVIAQGDQHNYLVTPNYGGQPNITRLENYGSNTGGVLAVTRWVKVTATCGSANMFTTQARVVGQPPAEVPEGPLALGIVAFSGIGVLSVIARRRRSPAAA